MYVMWMEQMFVGEKKQAESLYIIDKLKFKFFSDLDKLLIKNDDHITYSQFLNCIYTCKLYFLKLTMTTLELDYLWDHFYFEYIIQKRRQYFTFDETKNTYTENKKQVAIKTMYTMDMVESCFKFLQLQDYAFENITQDMVIKNYKKLAFKYHPDHGGTEADFIILQDSKDICLSFLQEFNKQ